MSLDVNAGLRSLKMPSSGNKAKINGRRRRPAKKSARKPANRSELVVITGMSGSGKATVLKAFEDLGYYCVDNLPVDLIARFAELCDQRGSRIERAAVVVDIREDEALSQLPTT